VGLPQAGGAGEHDHSARACAAITFSGVATFEYQFVMLRTKPKIKMEIGEVMNRTRARRADPARSCRSHPTEAQKHRRARSLNSI
jgi:hypothetical protein